VDQAATAVLVDNHVVDTVRIPHRTGRDALIGSPRIAAAPNIHRASRALTGASTARCRRQRLTSSPAALCFVRAATVVVPDACRAAITVGSAVSWGVKAVLEKSVLPEEPSPMTLLSAVMWH